MGQVIKFPVAKRFSKTQRTNSFTIILEPLIMPKNMSKIVDKLDDNLDKNITQMFDELGMKKDDEPNG